MHYFVFSVIAPVQAVSKAAVCAGVTGRTHAAGRVLNPEGLLFSRKQPLPVTK